MIERRKYLEKLISKKGNGLVKIITGIRRSGKSYLLQNPYIEGAEDKIGFVDVVLGLLLHKDSPGC